MQLEKCSAYSCKVAVALDGNSEFAMAADRVVNDGSEFLNEVPEDRGIRLPVLPIPTFHNVD